VITIHLDTREPDPHPWARYWDFATIVRATLGVGDICIAGNADVAVERKTPEDLIGCMGAGRERFERELRRACHIDRFVVIISSSLDDLLLRKRGMNTESVLGTLAAWQRRYRHPFMFCGNDQLAADFCQRFLTQPVREAKDFVKAVEACAA
jgi:ERCC4-type nuclease